MKFNSWYLSSFIVSFIVAIPILTVFASFFQETTNYYDILKNTFLIEYIYNSLTLLIGVLILTLVELPEIGEKRAGTASGMFFTAAEMGGLVGPLTLGILYDPTLGFSSGLIFLSVISGGMIVGALLLGRSARA